MSHRREKDSNHASTIAPYRQHRKNNNADGSSRQLVESRLVPDRTSDGALDYSGTIARQGHSKDRYIHSSYSALIPIRSQSERNIGSTEDLRLERPSSQELALTAQSTKEALEKLSQSSTNNGKKADSKQVTHIKYATATRGGRPGRTTMIKMVDAQEDPFAPAKFKHTKVPAGPPSPPAPVLRSPPRKVTAEEQKEWSIPPSISNWKNPKGFTIAVDKRVAADGRGSEQVTFSDKKAQFAEALALADKAAREQIREKQALKQAMAEQEAQSREERLRELARKAREERHNRQQSSEAPDEPMTEGERQRWKDRSLRLKEAETEVRMSRMGNDRRAKALAKSEGREISDKVALGVARPSQVSGDSRFDSRLFSQAPVSSRISEDQVYDKSLFAAHEAVRSIYKPRLGTNINASQDDNDDGAIDIGSITKDDRFGLKRNHESVDREIGPVQFERDEGTTSHAQSQPSTQAEEPVAKKPRKSRWDVES